MTEMIVRKGGEIKTAKVGDTGFISGYLCLFGNSNTNSEDLNGIGAWQHISFLIRVNKSASGGIQRLLPER